MRGGPGGGGESGRGDVQEASDGGLRRACVRVALGGYTTLHYTTLHYTTLQWGRGSHIHVHASVGRSPHNTSHARVRVRVLPRTARVILPHTHAPSPSPSPDPSPDPSANPSPASNQALSPLAYDSELRSTPRLKGPGSSSAAARLSSTPAAHSHATPGSTPPPAGGSPEDAGLTIRTPRGLGQEAWDRGGGRPPAP